MGTTFLHYDYFGAGTPPQLQGQFQDTTYYLIPAPVVPLLIPLTYMPWVGRPLAIALDPAMRVLIETGYDRTINPPGLPTPAKYFYIPNLIRAAFDFAVAIPTDGTTRSATSPAIPPIGLSIPRSRTAPLVLGGDPRCTREPSTRTATRRRTWLPRSPHPLLRLHRTPKQHHRTWRAPPMQRAQHPYRQQRRLTTPR